jgi:hypothetical protein
MANNLIYLPIAEKELDNSFTWYQNIETKLGSRFEAEIKDKLQ